jgi:hypothetical protein
VPIRSPRGRAAAYRALWQWPLRSPLRLALSAVVAVAVAVGVSFGVASLTGNAGAAGGSAPSASSAGGSPSSRTSDWSANAAPTPTALPPVPALEPTTLPLSQAPPEALEVAADWSAAWVRPPEGTTAQEWVEGLRPTTTREYLGVLDTVDPGNIPATRVTDAPRAVRVAPDSVQVEVPTDALTLLVLVVETEDGWRVAGYDRA